VGIQIAPYGLGVEDRLFMLKRTEYRNGGYDDWKLTFEVRRIPDLLFGGPSKEIAAAIGREIQFQRVRIRQTERRVAGGFGIVGMYVLERNRYGIRRDRVPEGAAR
jgi:hypothetical protein